MVNSDSINKDQPTPKQDFSRITWLWIGGSGIGTALGAVLALILFPDAAFGRNPMGQFGWNLLGFALSVGIPFALVQWLILRKVPTWGETTNISLLVLWIPVTSIGIASMILPLWWYSAELFMFVPWAVVEPMAPGIMFLAVGQWLLLYRVIRARVIWVLLTILGAMIGIILGLVAAFLLPLPLEVSWAFMTGICIGALQANALVSDLRNHFRQQE